MLRKSSKAEALTLLASPSARRVMKRLSRPRADPASSYACLRVPATRVGAPATLLHEKTVKRSSEKRTAANRGRYRHFHSAARWPMASIALTLRSSTFEVADVDLQLFVSS